ncbi:hypothetical protein K435DRAFT_901553 [Dendrothele bispora CBS 962.96]|uniref:Pinin/SDK/MemA protein domain-containing protein n=1 Tax=Dendrothele bispora (strain CBS 962.96) TaxID=1314807 RepID=A0A4S8MXV7_DENBC|nr:hypothetical protein K435DRAFT_901553 [Dendrothele bispora CBS 962.96]
MGRAGRTSDDLQEESVEIHVIRSRFAMSDNEYVSLFSCFSFGSLLILCRAPQDVHVDKPTPTEPVAMAATSSKSRPKLDLSAETKAGAAGSRERRRGKTMFGLVLGTLNKAKIEDKERNASDAAKKRQMIEQRLQIKLRKETDSVRRAEEAKKDKTIANRKEEELQLKDSIYKLRRTRFPLLANFLCTSDNIPDIPASDSDDVPSGITDPLAQPPRSHPPPLYYLPAILTPAQEAFIKKRKELVTEAAEKEWDLFREERSAGIEEIRQLRQRVADEEARKKSNLNKGNEEEGGDMDVEIDNNNNEDDTGRERATGASKENGDASTSKPAEPEADSMSMDKEGAPAAASAPTSEKKESGPGAVQTDDDDAVEY